jgi:hypothetical protein
LADDVRPAASQAGVVKGHDARVRTEAGQRADLAADAGSRRIVEVLDLEQGDGNFAPQLHIVREVYRLSGAFSEQFDYVVTLELGRKGYRSAS